MPRRQATLTRTELHDRACPPTTVGRLVCEVPRPWPMSLARSHQRSPFLLGLATEQAVTLARPPTLPATGAHLSRPVAPATHPPVVKTARLPPARRSPLSVRDHPRLRPPRASRTWPCRGSPRLLCHLLSIRATTLLAVARRLLQALPPIPRLLGLKPLLDLAAGPREASPGGPRLRQVSGVRKS